MQQSFDLLRNGELDIMSDYKREKVVRCRVDMEYIKSHLDLEELFDIDTDERYEHLFGYGTVGKFQIAPTEDFFIDYVLESEYGVCCGEFGKTRHLSSSELEKYKCIFSEIIPGDLIDDENIRVVEYCWYNATECESYFDETDDDFYDEV